VPPEHCFAFGCERSGTTPLTLLLHAHPQVVIGMERYKYIFRTMRRTHDPELLDAGHFEAERFLDLRETDTNHTPGRFGAHYESARQRFAAGDVAWVGDKVMPPDEWLLLTLADRFPSARFVFVYRDLLRVANSFEVRARNPDDANWPTENDHRLGAEHRRTAFRTVEALGARAGWDRVFVVRAERLFAADPREAEAMFAFLDLDLDDDLDGDGDDGTVRSAVEARRLELRTQWARRQSTPLILSLDQQRWLLEDAGTDDDERFDRSSGSTRRARSSMPSAVEADPESVERAQPPPAPAVVAIGGGDRPAGQVDAD
jgi:Sulfotransferase family